MTTQLPDDVLAAARSVARWGDRKLGPFDIYDAADLESELVAWYLGNPKRVARIQGQATSESWIPLLRKQFTLVLKGLRNREAEASPPVDGPTDREARGAYYNLPERTRDIFAAVALEGRSQASVAAEYGISQQRVSQLIDTVYRHCNTDHLHPQRESDEDFDGSFGPEEAAVRWSAVDIDGGVFEFSTSRRQEFADM